MLELKGDPAGAPYGLLRSGNKIGRLRNSPWRDTQTVPHCEAQTVLAFTPILPPALSAPEGNEKPVVRMVL